MRCEPRLASSHCQSGWLQACDPLRKSNPDFLLCTKRDILVNKALQSSPHVHNIVRQQANRGAQGLAFKMTGPKRVRTRRA